MTTKTTATSKNVTRKPVARTRRQPTVMRIKVSTWKNVGQFINSRFRDIALMAIVLGAFVAVFDGSLYSATKFSFIGVSAVAFAIMPDALMVLAAAKMRQLGVTKAQWTTAHRWMKIALAFSLLTNMIAAFLRNCPAEWINQYVLLTGAVLYHGMIVVFLKGAVDVLTKTREDRKVKAANASEASAQVTEVPAPARLVPPIFTRAAQWQETALSRLIGAHRPGSN